MSIGKFLLDCCIEKFQNITQTIDWHVMFYSMNDNTLLYSISRPCEEQKTAWNIFIMIIFIPRIVILIVNSENLPISDKKKTFHFVTGEGNVIKTYMLVTSCWRIHQPINQIYCQIWIIRSFLCISSGSFDSEYYLS